MLFLHLEQKATTNVIKCRNFIIFYCFIRKYGSLKWMSENIRLHLSNSCITCIHTICICMQVQENINKYRPGARERNSHLVLSHHLFLDTSDLVSCGTSSLASACCCCCAILSETQNSFQALDSHGQLLTTLRYIVIYSLTSNPTELLGN